MTDNEIIKALKCCTTKGASCKDCLHCEVCKKMHWHIVESKYMYQMQDVETRCEHYKEKIPDNFIMYTTGKWLVLNTESEDLGKAIKSIIDYCTNGERG